MAAACLFLVAAEETTKKNSAEVPVAEADVKLPVVVEFETEVALVAEVGGRTEVLNVDELVTGNSEETLEVTGARVLEAISDSVLDVSLPLVIIGVAVERGMAEESSAEVVGRAMLKLLRVITSDGVALDSKMEDRIVGMLRERVAELASPLAEDSEKIELRSPLVVD